MKRLFSFFTIVALLGAQNLQAQWIRTNGPYGGNVNCFAVNGSHLFAGSYYGGVFLSTNNGANWTPVNTGLTNTRVFSLAVSHLSLFAGTDGGVWRRPLSEIITAVKDDFS